MTHAPAIPTKAATADGGPRMAEDPDKTRLDAFETRLARARAEKAGAASGGVGKNFSQSEMAWRMVIELVSGIGIGFGIGYGLDVLFGTMPFLMVLFVLLGLAAGIKTVIRTATEMQEKRQAAEAAADEGK